MRAALSLGEFESPDGIELTLQAKMLSPLRDGVYTVVPPSTDASASGFSHAATSGATMQLNQAAPIQYRNQEERRHGVPHLVLGG